jgi:uncharacterized membrane protein YccC
MDQLQDPDAGDQGSDMIRVRATRRRGQPRQRPLWKRRSFWIAVAAAAAILFALWLISWLGSPQGPE